MYNFNIYINKLLQKCAKNKDGLYQYIENNKKKYNFKRRIK